jgi:hypothetical protein
MRLDSETENWRAHSGSTQLGMEMAICHDDPHWGERGPLRAATPSYDKLPR